MYKLCFIVYSKEVPTLIYPNALIPFQSLQL